ncbi:BQ2448_1853 [Microbotryum intermedium]|uniref:BQ2448_1853 protein n=1 Tax=Microbotryum intermedium TaxID=269621 RepID=A0A238FCE9_9BASI|nr:BQ2448_1853 [Microbotryum intermedium]
MASRNSKTDLVVRVRYQNKLPPPPFPPRLLHIPTSPHRYANAAALNALASEREVPMILDGELGLPIELGKIPDGAYGDGEEEYWIGNRSAIVPTGPAPIPHKDDLFLLGDVAAPGPSSASSSFVGTPGHIPPGGGTPAMGDRRKVDVSWLRRTEYLSSDPGSKVLTDKQAPSAPKPDEPLLDSLSRDARAKAISSTFTAAHIPLSELRHPSKPHLRAEEVWDVLPDSELWPNQLNLVRFGEDPGERADKEASHVNGTGFGHGFLDPRLPRALFRPVELPGDDNRVGYYLPVSDQVAQAYTKKREKVQEEEEEQGGANGDGDEDEGYEFAHVRDYVITTTRRLVGEYVFVVHDGLGKEPNQGGETVTSTGDKQEQEGGPGGKKRARGAYFTPVKMAQTLRKRRPRRGEDPTVFAQDPDRSEEDQLVFWDKIQVKVTPIEEVLPEAEREERENELRTVTEPPRV